MSDTSTNRKVGPVTLSAAAGTTAAGALTTLLVWVLNMLGVDVPSEVAAALTVLIGIAGTIVGGWVAKPTGGAHAAE